MAFQRSTHDKKYDRQMRLWGPHGQEALETANLCILGSGATASETLKNLILPSVGHFTVIDHALVESGDLENNFFVDSACLGKPRAEMITNFLLELNREVKGQAINKNFYEIIDNDINSFLNYTLVIAFNINSEPHLLKLANFLFEQNIPLIIVNNRGFQATMRIQINEHIINESHPSGDRSELLLEESSLANFPELENFLSSFHSDLQNKLTVDTEQHAHIPYPAILTFAIKLWKQNHGDRSPASYEEKKKFLEFVGSLKLNREDIIARRKLAKSNQITIENNNNNNNNDNNPEDEEAIEDLSETNFDEAQENIKRVCNKLVIDPLVLSILERERDFSSTVRPGEKLSSRDAFWILCRAVYYFKTATGALPVSTDIPDMHCKTAYYVQLKAIYAAKANKDLENIADRVRALLKSLGRAEDEIPFSYIQYFVKNIRSIRVINTSPLSQEYNPETFNFEAVNADIEDFKDSHGLNDDFELESEEQEEDENGEAVAVAPKLIVHNFLWYCALRAIPTFRSKFNREPATLQDSSFSIDSDEYKEQMDKRLEEDTLALAEIVNEFIYSTKVVNTGKVTEVCFEVLRSYGVELHNVAAFMGGVVSQEALKIIIKQFVPLNNTFIYNAIDCSSTTLKL